MPAGLGLGLRGLVALAALCAAAAAAPGGARASQPPHGGFAAPGVEPVLVLPLAPPDAAAPGALPGLLSLPPLWFPGDAAAVLVPDVPGPDPVRHRLVAALLAEGAAVLELDVQAARGGAGPDGAAPAPAAAPRVAEILPGLFGALRALRLEVGAGLVVAIGTGPAAGAAALRAAGGRAPGDLRLDADEAGFVAAAALGPGMAAFAAGAAAPEAERWDLRMGPLCAALARAAAGADPAPAGGAAAGELAAECRAALGRRRPPGARPVASATAPTAAGR